MDWFEVGNEHGDQQLDVETLDNSVDLATVKQEIFNDDTDNATMDRALSPCNSDSMEQKFSYELLDAPANKQSESVTFGQSRGSHEHLDTSANNQSNKNMSYGRGRGSCARRSSSRRGRPPGSKNCHGVSVTNSGRNMSLEQIWRLNDKLLVNYFSEPSSNELTRNFAYTCALMPQTCAETFTSFGSELKARNMMKEHLLNHMRQLVTRSRVEPGFAFFAQKVQARKNAAGGVRGRRRKTNERSPEKPSMMDAITLMESYGRSDRSTDSCLAETRIDERTTSSSDANIVKHESLEDVSASPSSAVLRTYIRRRAVHSRVVESETNEIQVDEVESLFLFGDHPYSVTCTQKKSRSNDTTDCLSSYMPDTRTSGRKYALGDTEFDGLTNDPDDEQLMNIVIQMHMPRQVVASRLIIPMIRVPRSALMPDEDVGAPAKKDDPPTSVNATSEFDNHDQPSINVATRPIDILPRLLPRDSDTHITIPQRAAPVRRRTLRTAFNNKSEFERKMAIQFMRELKNRSKEQKDQEPFECKICKTKTFTAIATLMYHYRSHAGIKPYICMICNTTFTRQHSLNYHMLIHNNQNRFTCKDCGRRFRHPSHFKEHLRRHTGETPFMCGDCSSRFKTRNTYKRHLRTRHGKLLVASGIIRMKPEDFLRVRTKPYLSQASAEAMSIEANEQAGIELQESLDGQLEFLEDNKDNIDIIDLPSSIVDQIESSMVDTVFE